MDLTQLRYLQTIAQCGSLTKAARLLRTSQPTLSVAIQHLEEHYKTTLLLRDRSGVSLTATGQELLRHAEEVFALLERAEQSILGLEAQDAGSFVLGCHESLGAYFLPTFMRRFLEEAPRISLSLWNGTSAAVQEAVLQREVHFGLVVNALPQPDLVLVELFADAVDVFVAGDAPEGSPKESVAEAQERLRRGPLLYAGRVVQCQDLIRRLAAAGLLPQRMLSCGDLELVKSLVLADLGVALLPRRVAAYGQPGRLRRLHPSLPFIPDTIYLVYRADVHRTQGALKLKNALVAYGKSL